MPQIPAPRPEAPEIAVAGAAVRPSTHPVEGTFVTVDGVESYRIENVDRMAPFFVTVVSGTDHWLFASSTGALTAGRTSPDHPLFPYETVDRIHDAEDRTGSKTVLLVTEANALTESSSGPGKPERKRLWEPFSDRYAGLYAIRRSLTKSLQGDRLRFEEVNDDLGLALAVTWCTSERFGFVKRTEIRSVGPTAATVRVLDGVQNLMPYGISRDLQATRSVLADAYKKNERVPGTTLGLFTLSAIPVDKAEPSEALKATTVWSVGVEPDALLLSTRQIDRFRADEGLESETAIRAERGAYFVDVTLRLGAGETRRWTTVADIDQDAADVIGLVDALADPDALLAALDADIDAGTRRLCCIAAGADSEQRTAEPLTSARHRMNVLFNIMRGGVFDEGYSIVREDVRAHVAHHNARLAAQTADLFDALPERVTVQALRDAARARGPQIERLCAAYLPLSFSRRHGDPSRPWNDFSIDLHTPDGAIKRGYEGNWRDIFQNWEALGRSYPGYLDAFVATFVNASTADGYNPYRITDEGIDWETIEPDDPWSYIGYWGDHQLIYLLRLLTLSRAHHPDRLVGLLSRRLFSYANVPYRIKPYADLIRDPHDTVAFDADLEAEIERRVEAMGADGKMLLDADGEVVLVTLAEKLLVTLLAKLTNLVPEGGVWMNTQRPEWNDANNALVGYGVSVVTLFALRRTLTVLRDLFPADGTLEMSREVAALLGAVSSTLGRFEPLARAPMTDADRRRVVDALGEAGSAYRDVLYRRGLSGETEGVASHAVHLLLDRAQVFADQAIAANRREDGIFHTYNLMGATPDAVAIRHLYPMLEGQVAALDSGVLSPETAAEVLDALRSSPIYRADQHSYRLYPDRDLPSFLEKNIVPSDAVTPLFETLLAAGDRAVVVPDVRGGVHFNGAFRNRSDLQAALDALKTGAFAEAVVHGEQEAHDVFERVFDHTAYTGRSGTFFGYEGLGSIYWHMVSKLALATQETFLRAHADGADAAVLTRLAEAYYDIRSGLGVCKTPAEYGAFPADAYSHTPGNAGAQQPGMTGQVKEDILCRWGELGVAIDAGRIAFRPHLLRDAEFLPSASAFHYVDVHGTERSIALGAGMLAFTYCQVPIVYRRAEALAVRVIGADRVSTPVDGDALSPEASSEIFRRTGSLSRIEVDLPPAF